MSLLNKVKPYARELMYCESQFPLPYVCPGPFVFESQTQTSVVLRLT